MGRCCLANGWYGLTFVCLIRVIGGGAVGILDANKAGKLEPTQVPLVSGHKGAVLDLEFDPFNDNIFATASEDCTAKLWRIPDGGLANGSQLQTVLLRFDLNMTKPGYPNFEGTQA